VSHRRASLGEWGIGALAVLVLCGPLVLASCCTEDVALPEPACEWPAGRDSVDPRTGEKGVFLTEAEWQKMWECRWYLRWVPAPK
jgi:hypothetical protein